MSNRVNSETRRIVASRANFVCEYCLIAEEDAYFNFQVKHIISRKHSGSSELENLALACVFCLEDTDAEQLEKSLRDWLE